MPQRLFTLFVACLVTGALHRIVPPINPCIFKCARRKKNPKVQSKVQSNSSSKVLKIYFVFFQGLGTKNSPGIIPIRGLLCSYKCFNVEGHDYFGVAQVGEQ